MGLAFLWLPSPPLFPLLLCHSGNVTVLVRRVSIPWAPLSEASCVSWAQGSDLKREMLPQAVQQAQAVAKRRILCSNTHCVQELEWVCRTF